MQILAILVMALPALPVLALSGVPEYWGRIYFWWGVTFAILSCAAASFTLRRARRHGQIPSVGQLFVAGMVAWCVSLLVLALIDFTPLCLGQDNGDGRNDVGMCVFLTGVWAVFMSVPVVPLVYVASRISRRSLIRLEEG